MSSHFSVTGIYGHYFKSYHGGDNKADWQVTQVTAPKWKQVILRLVFNI